MNSKTENWFYNSAAALLLLTAGAKLFSAGANTRILTAMDQLSHLDYRALIIAVACLEVAAAVFLLKSQSTLKRSLVLLWLTANFVTYHVGNYLLGIQTCPCLGTLADRLPLRRGLADTLLQGMLLYWLLGSLTFFWNEWGAEHWARLSLRWRNRFRKYLVPAHPS